MSKFDVDYFINKFEAIPGTNWTTGELWNSQTGACCALGHCGVRDVEFKHIGEDEPLYDGGGWLFTEEALELIKIFGGTNIHHAEDVYGVNDARSINEDEGPRERILNFLKQVKQKENDHG